MTSQTPTPRRFEEITEHSYADKFARTCDSTETRRGYLLTGTCPRCDHPMGFLVPTEILLNSTPAAPRPTKMMCTCEGEHPGRPPDDEGCGAYWNVELSGPAS
jgi:hypothetical protein